METVYLQNHYKIFVTMFPNPGNFLPEAVSGRTDFMWILPNVRGY